MFTGRTNTPSTEMAPAGALWLEDSVPRCTLGNVVFPELRRGFTPGLGGARDPPGGGGGGIVRTVKDSFLVVRAQAFSESWKSRKRKRKFRGKKMWKLEFQLNPKLILPLVNWVKVIKLCKL